MLIFSFVFYLLMRNFFNLKFAFIFLHNLVTHLKAESVHKSYISLCRISKLTHKNLIQFKRSYLTEKLVEKKNAFVIYKIKKDSIDNKNKI